MKRLVILAIAIVLVMVFFLPDLLEPLRDSANRLLSLLGFN